MTAERDAALAERDAAEHATGRAYIERDSAREALARAVELLVVLAQIPVEAFGMEDKPDRKLMQWNDSTLYVHDVLQARAFLAAQPETKP